MVHATSAVEAPPPGESGSARNRWWRTHVVPDPTLPLESRLFQVIAFIAATGTLGLLLPTNLPQNLPVALNVLVALFGLIALWVWRESRQGRERRAVLWTTLVVALNASWYFNAGSQGSVVLYFFHALILPVVIARGRVRLLVIGGVLANVVGLYVVDYLHPGWVIPYQSAFDRVLDNITGYVVCAVALVAILWSVLEAYVAERARLVDANAKLQQSLDEVRTLRGLLPICSWCRKVRDDEGLWTQIEEYVSQHTDASFTHGMCPECYERCDAESRRPRDARGTHDSATDQP